MYMSSMTGVICQKRKVECPMQNAERQTRIYVMGFACFSDFVSHSAFHVRHSALAFGSTLSSLSCPSDLRYTMSQQ